MNLISNITTAIMKPFAISLPVLLLAFAACATVDTRETSPKSTSRGEEASFMEPSDPVHREEIDTWHAGRIERLKSENGWLTLVGLAWLSDGPNAVGSDESSAVRLPDFAPERLGTFHLEDGEVRFSAAEGVEVTRNDGPLLEDKPLKSATGGNPDVLAHGTLRLHVIVRGDRVGIRIRDTDAPARLGFTGIDRFPVTSTWRKKARWEPADEGQILLMPNVIGQMTREQLAGTAVFTHDGQEYRLLASRDGERLFFAFTDETNRAETYGAGRFMSTDPPSDGTVVLDFNRAYNPPCALTQWATCPLPVRDNRLKVRVEAGEKRWNSRLAPSQDEAPKGD